MNKRKIYIGGGIFLLVVALGLIWHFTHLSKKQATVEAAEVNKSVAAVPAKETDIIKEGASVYLEYTKYSDDSQYMNVWDAALSDHENYYREGYQKSTLELAVSFEEKEYKVFTDDLMPLRQYMPFTATAHWVSVPEQKRGYWLFTVTDYYRPCNFKPGVRFSKGESEQFFDATSFTVFTADYDDHKWDRRWWTLHPEEESKFKLWLDQENQKINFVNQGLALLFKDTPLALRMDKLGMPDEIKGTCGAEGMDWTWNMQLAVAANGYNATIAPESDGYYVTLDDGAGSTMQFYLSDIVNYFVGTVWQKGDPGVKFIYSNDFSLDDPADSITRKDQGQLITEFKFNTLKARTDLSRLIAKTLLINANAPDHHNPNIVVMGYLQNGQAVAMVLTMNKDLGLETKAVWLLDGEQKYIKTDIINFTDLSSGSIYLIPEK